MTVDSFKSKKEYCNINTKLDILFSQLSLVKKKKFTKIATTKHKDVTHLNCRHNRANQHSYFLFSERVVLTKGKRGYQGLVLDLNLSTTQSTQPHSSTSFQGFSLSFACGTRSRDREIERERERERERETHTILGTRLRVHSWFLVAEVLALLVPYTYISLHTSSLPVLIRIPVVTWGYSKRENSLVVQLTYL